ncbi:hypothetical protein EVAR_103890_1 [Eumeta japonica]|uniref:Uncharacterized protein n=1 Tax=Eumeta variegata TaxID=151549 RepID=A0A4C1ZQ25_EUMVA|nr:hypothetical protein EVAR_103890_1 [Eumeta japonica]
MIFIKGSRAGVAQQRRVIETQFDTSIQLTIAPVYVVRGVEEVVRLVLALRRPRALRALRGASAARACATKAYVARGKRRAEMGDEVQDTGETEEEANRKREI